MKRRLRKRKKIRGGRAVSVFRCITDPTGSLTLWQGPDGVFRPLMRTHNVYFEVAEKVKGTSLDAIREHMLNPIPPQGISGTIEIDDDPSGEKMRDMLAAFQSEVLRTLRERLPEDIYDTLPEWAKVKEEPTA